MSAIRNKFETYFLKNQFKRQFQFFNIIVYVEKVLEKEIDLYNKVMIFSRISDDDDLS